MEVRLEHGHLTAAFESEPEATLYPRGRHGFYYRVADARITFVEDADGGISGLILHQALDRPDGRQEGRRAGDRRASGRAVGDHHGAVHQ